MKRSEAQRIVKKMSELKKSMPLLEVVDDERFVALHERLNRSRWRAIDDGGYVRKGNKIFARGMKLVRVDSEEYKKFKKGE